MNLTLANVTIEVPLVPLGVTKKVIKKLNEFQAASAQEAAPDQLLEIATDCLVLVTGKTVAEIDDLPIGANELPLVITGISEACGLVFKQASEAKTPAAK